jgi:glycine cleavage system H lipoate-binding protein
VNQEVLDNPRLVSQDHYGGGWFVVMEPTNLDEDKADLAHGDDVLPWLTRELEEYEAKDLIKKEEERECV